MAITVSGSPQVFSPAFNPLYFYFDSDNKTEEGFRYIADVANNDALVFARLKLAPSPNLGLGVTDVHQIIKSQVSGGLQVDNNTMSANTDTYVVYGVIYGEEYINYWEYDDVEFVFSPSPFESFAALVNTGSSTNQIYQAGDNIFVDQDTGFSNPSYNGVHTVLSANPTTIIINVPFGTGTTATEGGRVSYADKRKTQFYPLGTIKNFIAFNGAASHQQLFSWDPSTYDMTSSTGTTGEFLTNIPDCYKVKPENKMWWNMYSSNYADEIFRARIITKYGVYRLRNQFTGDTFITTLAIGPANIAIADTQWNNNQGSYPIIKNVTWDFISVADSGGNTELIGLVDSPWVGFVDTEIVSLIIDGAEILVEILSATSNSVVIDLPFASLSSSTITQNSIYQITDSYDVDIQSNFDDVTSEVKTVCIDFGCTRYGNIELYFIDRLGSYIPANFELQSFKQMDISRDEYQRLLGGFDGTGWAFDSTNRGRVNINTTVKNQVTLNSNWLTEAEANYLKELFSSPDVYINENGQLWPVIVKSNSYRIVTKKNAKNIKIEIVVEYANNDVINNIN